jgi:type III pantothenate kinase
MNTPLIAVDIGNSSINIGYFTNQERMVQKIRTDPLRNADAYCSIMGAFQSKNHIEKKPFNGIISSVVPGYIPVFKDVLERLSDRDITPDIVMVSHRLDTGLGFAVRNPDELGADRIAGAVGAYERYKTHVAVIDFGTATTVTVVDADAQYIGGAIMPGLALMSEALATGTGKLKKIVLDPPSAALGIDTTGCIQSGIFYGSAGAVERVMEEIENKEQIHCKVVITGGFAKSMHDFIKRPHDIDQHLTLEGLRILYEKNRAA